MQIPLAVAGRGQPCWCRGHQTERTGLLSGTALRNGAGLATRPVMTPGNIVRR
ncbi:hypothetical protein LHK_02674 [Laribacter hongkongensis HLHK9]|uniref:Uncharacterized protein n=1 Tax=Laribacter hongkongensis (strain HLHK9) TaxID=557598 RepID=C1DCN6_LARHH|nr:hypothetical protein LHK_02674 [Laribacter hongkongensis HLHK9]